MREATWGPQRVPVTIVGSVDPGQPGAGSPGRVVLVEMAHGGTTPAPTAQVDLAPAAAEKPKPTVQWVELPDPLIQRIYRLDLGVDDLDHRIAVLVSEAEGRQPRPPQCPYEGAPDAVGFVRPCQLGAGHDGPHATTSRAQEDLR